MGGEGGGSGGGMGGAAQFVRGNSKSFQDINLTVLEIMHRFIMGGAGRARQLHLCVEPIYPLRG